MTAEIVKQVGALAIRPDQTEWLPAQAAVLQQSGIDNQVTTEELSAFLHLCQRTGLDPFSRQIYLIGRWDKKQQRKVYTPQTGIDGYRVVAHRAAERAGHSYGYDDTLWCDASGRWRDVWLADGPPAAAKVTVIRNGMKFAAVARYSEYAQTFPDGNPSGLWGKMPAGQTAKCAEALALRMAFPFDLAGVYTAEEMAQADNQAPHLRAVQQGEPDPWTAPQQAAPARDFVTEARSAADADAVRGIWQEAKAAGLDETLLGQIAAVGKSLTATPTAKPEPAADKVVDAEAISDEEQDALDAERELRAFGEQEGLPDIARDFEAAKGLPLSQAIAPQIRSFLAELSGNAA